MISIEELKEKIKQRILNVYNYMDLDDIDYNYGIAEGLFIAYQMLFEGPTDSLEIQEASNMAIKRLTGKLIERYS